MANDTVVRVRYPEVDRMGVAHHSSYFVWFEIARTEWLRATGRSYRDLEDVEGIQLPVVSAGARYRAPARYDDRLEVRALPVSARGARVRFEYEVRREGQAAPLLATGYTEHAAVNREGRPVRVPDDLRRRFEARESDE
jgi:acyl-CoA thioester hydrolase